MRSSLFLVRAMTAQGLPAVLRSGDPDTGEEVGVLTDTGWQSHAWVESRNFVVDITADQFGYPPVVVCPRVDPVYRPAGTGGAGLSPSVAAIAAVDRVWSQWCALRARAVGQLAPNRIEGVNRP